jgi:ribose transport system substrate-binding protein
LIGAQMDGKEVPRMLKRVSVVAICLLVGLLLTGAVFAGGQGDGKGGKAVTLVVSIRGLDNPYHANYKNGADALGKKLGLAVDTLSTEANSEKGIADIKAEVAKTGGNMVLNLDPNQAPDVVPIAKILETAGVYWVNWWNKPDDVKVWDYPHWVAHISFDSVGTGYFNAKELFKTFKTPNQGKIVALQGMLANTPAVERFQGLQKALAEFPGVKLLQWEGCDWDRTKAYNATKAMLVAHPDVDGIWSANDEMAMGAIQALKEAGLAGKVMVDSKYQAQLGLMMSKAAKEGKLDVAKLPRKHRSFKISGVEVNKANIDKVMKDYANLSPEYDFSDFFAKWAAEAP